MAVASTSKIRLEDWDALAPLDSPAARQSVVLLEERVQQRPLPARFSKQKQVTPATHFLSRASTPVNGLNSPVKRSGSVPRFSNGIVRSSTPPIALNASWRKDIQQPIETHQQFQDWYSQIEGLIEAEQEADYREYLGKVSAHVEDCNGMLDRLEASRGLLKEMDANYRFVEDNSRALQVACENMLDEQKHLIEVTGAITARLEYFRELERATKMLNSPGENIVLDPGFLDLLDRLDVCLDFLRANRSFKDAEIYLIRFQQCLTRSMTLIKIYFANMLATLTNSAYDTLAKLSTDASSITDTALRALLYTKFENAAQPDTRMLLFELEKRAQVQPDEYASLLSECWANWFASRGGLLSDSVSNEVRLLDPYKADLVKLTRSGCNYLRSLCTDEWNLFREYFSDAGSAEMYRFLETLCDHLFDFLRPRILHEQKLDVLCEICNIVQAMMALDVDDEPEAEPESLSDETRMDYGSPTRSRSFFSPGSESMRSPFDVATPTRSIFAVDFSQAQEQVIVTNPQPLKSLRFGELLQTILHDMQTRLVFRAQAIIQTEVLHYVPTEEDLNYPAKIKSLRRSSFWAQDDNLDKGASFESRLPDESVQETWYPTLRKTIWVLSRLHTYVKNAIFEDFAGEAVTICRQSLVVASQKIALRPGAEQLDGQLFSIRHLLILKEMVRSVDLVQIERAADFSSVTDALSNLLRNTATLFNPGALFQAASKSMPSFAETMKDAKIDVDVALKAVCEDLIVQAGLGLSAPLRSFMQRARQYLDQKVQPNDPPLDLPAQEWASPEFVKQIHDTFVAEGTQGGLERSMNDLLENLNLWLGDQRTVAILIPPIQDEVSEVYTSFYNLVKTEYQFEVSSKLLAPTLVRDRLRVIAGSVGAQSKKG